jgi:hypothetical protein
MARTPVTYSTPMGALQPAAQPQSTTAQGGHSAMEDQRLMSVSSTDGKGVYSKSRLCRVCHSKAVRRGSITASDDFRRKIIIDFRKKL